MVFTKKKKKKVEQPMWHCYKLNFIDYIWKAVYMSQKDKKECAKYDW